MSEIIYVIETVGAMWGIHGASGCLTKVIAIMLRIFPDDLKVVDLYTQILSVCRRLQTR